ncbi:MAG: undecaprenyldiphospho-muramoylpentapeptide beta-N-acetylglucosaminyltransferase [Bdellovibrionaceae bacterium]|nr:undecaprenyldiphospho-muramoylpentapeptide beta-N-acetylglucosaminyltransferase [Pseudobdellovibrionaceae bacterium]
MKKRTVIIAGGGTGGHIYPGVAIARALEKMHPEIEVHFVGARGGLEEKIVPRENFPLHTVQIGKLHKSVGLAARLRTLIQLPLALLASLRILRRLDPVAVLGVGGFASGPLLLMASLCGYRSLIWEPNAFPGLANRWLARMANECLVVFQDAGRFLHARRLTPVGLPVRPVMVPRPRPAHELLRVLVFGGSQGARAINEVISQSVADGGEWLNGVELIHQTGSLDYPRIQELYSKKAPAQVQLFEYLHDMDQRYAWADLVICRAGASTVAEICACRKAAVFIPLPTAADNHQQKNAEVLVRGGAAEMVLQKDFTPAKFQALIQQFRDDRARIGRLEENVSRFAFPNAAEAIVGRVLDFGENGAHP